jgi:hypothetical protein
LVVGQCVVACTGSKTEKNSREAIARKLAGRQGMAPGLTFEEDSKPSFPIEVPVEADGVACDSDILSYTSSNLDLIPSVGGVVFSGTAPTCQVDLALAINASGKAEITLHSSALGDDIKLGAFKIIVAPVNDPPIIEQLPEQLIDPDSEESIISVNVTDVDSDIDCAKSLTIEEISNSLFLPKERMSISGSNGKCEIKLQTSANQMGRATVKKLHL